MTPPLVLVAAAVHHSNSVHLPWWAIVALSGLAIGAGIPGILKVQATRKRAAAASPAEREPSGGEPGEG